MITKKSPNHRKPKGLPLALIGILFGGLVFSQCSKSEESKDTSKKKTTFSSSSEALSLKDDTYAHIQDAISQMEEKEWPTTIRKQLETIRKQSNGNALLQNFKMDTCQILQNLEEQSEETTEEKRELLLSSLNFRQMKVICHVASEMSEDG